MIDYARRDIELIILYGLDDCLIKISGELQNHFDPKEKQSINLLKTFHTLIETRRKWAREYRLVPLPESAAASQVSQKAAGERQGKVTPAHSQAEKSKSLSEAAIEDVVNSFSKRKCEPNPVPRGLLAR